ncbi:MAG: lantibiotic dehydratase [Pseudonocardiaceae bacterium]
MGHHPFVVQAEAGLARIPLLPAEGSYDHSSAAVNPLLIEGMLLASRQVGAAAISAEHPVDDRLAATLRGYEIRARLRPTPNAVFAGVAPAVFSRETASLRLGGGHRARSNPSAAWLTAVCAQLLEDPDVLALLILTVSNLITRRGRRLEHEQQAAPGRTGPHRVTVRATDATMLILRTCRAGATVDQVIAEVGRRWSTVPESVVRATVLGLVRAGFLLSDLLPGDLGDDPLGHLLGRLPAVSPVREKLASLRRLLADADQCRPGYPSRLAALIAARDLADEISFQERALSVDVVADAHLVLPTALADQAARAAGVLWRIGWGRGPLTGYHDRFLDRYGPHRFVPLSEATDPAIGLGIDTDASDIDAAPPPPGRTTVLTALLAHGTTRGGTEVVLDAEAIAALAGDQTAEPPPRTAEIHVRVLAATQQDLALGRLHLAVCPGGGSQDAGSSQGRFTGLLPGTLSDLGDPSTLVAELAVRPRVSEGAALAPQTGFAPWRIPVGVPVRDGDLVLDDLLLVSNGDRLMVWSASRDRQVVPVLYSRLAPRLLPPLARFLQLLGHTGCRPWRGWSWGPLADLPFQPRVRYERTVLSPARWVLPPELTGMVHDRTAWNGALHTWRTAATPPPPDIVVTEDADRRLPLDLRRPDDRELLRRYVRRGVLAVAEQPGGPDAIQAVVPGPTGDHVLELVVPLARRTTVTEPARPADTPVRATGTGLHLPGGPWLSLTVRGPSHCHDQILSELAAAAAGLTGHFDTWFWLRYADTSHGSHIRARFHGNPAALGGRVLPALSAWCSEMIRQRLSGGFTVEPYDQEIERYGGPDAIHAAEQVFAADSHLVLKALATTTDPDQRLVIAALSAAAIARAVADGDPAALRGHHLDRAARQRVVTLRPQVRSTRSQDDTNSPIPSLTDPAWIARQDALTSYRDTLKPAHRPSCASALIHMHTNRLLGRADTERMARALAADLLALPTSAP